MTGKPINPYPAWLRAALLMWKACFSCVVAVWVVESPGLPWWLNVVLAAVWAICLFLDYDIECMQEEAMRPDRSF